MLQKIGLLCDKFHAEKLDILCATSTCNLIHSFLESFGLKKRIMIKRKTVLYHEGIMHFEVDR